MSALREASQLAVEVLRQWVIPRAGVGTVHYKKALELLRGALAKPDDKAQPVAWVDPGTLRAFQDNPDKQSVIGIRRAEMIFPSDVGLYVATQPTAEPMEFAAWRRILAEKVDAYIQGESDGEGAGEDAYDDLKAHILAVPVSHPPAEQQCEYCGGTGDIHRADGEWLGECTACQKPVEQGAELPNVVATAPERIYLVIGEDCPPEEDFSILEEVTWCADKIDENSIEYVRLDRAARGGV